MTSSQYPQKLFEPPAGTDLNKTIDKQQESSKKAAFTILSGTNKRKIVEVDLDKEEQKEIVKRVSQKFDKRKKEIEEDYLLQSRIFEEQFKKERERLELELKERQTQLEGKKLQKIQEIGKKETVVLLEEVEKEVKDTSCVNIANSGIQLLKPGDNIFSKKSGSG